MPSLVHFMIKHTLIGFCVAALFVAMLLYFDVMGLRVMIMKEDLWWVAILILWFGNATVFGAVQVAYAVMNLAED